MGDAIGFVSRLFQYCFAIVERIFTEFNAWAIIFSAFIIYTLYRLLLRPIFGGLVSAGASDTVRKIRAKRDERS